jgi:hypothetical protein
MTCDGGVMVWLHKAPPSTPVMLNEVKHLSANRQEAMPPCLHQGGALYGQRACSARTSPVERAAGADARSPTPVHRSLQPAYPAVFNVQGHSI